MKKKDNKAYLDKLKNEVAEEIGIAGQQIKETMKEKKIKKS